MITDKLKKNIDQSVNILRRYHRNAIERKNPNAKTDIEIVMATVQDLSRLVFDDKSIPIVERFIVGVEDFVGSEKVELIDGYDEIKKEHE